MFLRRVAALALLASLAGAPAAAAAASWTRRSPTHCCRSKASCCCKSQGAKAGPEWKAARDCPRRCAAPGNLAVKLLWAPAATTIWRCGSDLRPVPARETAGIRSAFPASLYQRPPPA
jgi:hypothetical protein